MKLYLVSNIGFLENLYGWYVQLVQEYISNIYINIFKYFSSVVVLLNRDHPTFNVSISIPLYNLYKRLLLRNIYGNYVRFLVTIYQLIYYVKF